MPLWCAVSLRAIVEKIADKLDSRELIQFRTPQASNSEPASLLPDITRLLSVGWKKKYDLDTGLDDTIAWWKDQMPARP
jgi:nucleoside-diphosphate-sugar epimerase